jgi:hypothetical protein
MATKNSRLSEILKQEYKTSGVVGGLASAAGKRALEKLDIRNALFGGSGVGSLIGRKIFGKGYSAIAEKSSADKLSSQSTPILAAQSDKLDVIGMNTQITAKNSMALPSMARDMNVMRQNVSKLVKLQGGTATNKADAFFAKAKDREGAYEAQFGAKKETSPTKVGDNKETNRGILGTIIAFLTMGVSKIFDTLKSTVGSFTGMFSGLIAKLPGVMSLMEGLATVLRVGIAAITSPLGLLAAGLTAAVVAVKFFTDKILGRAEKEGGSEGRDLASQSIAETMSGAMDGNFVTGTNAYGEQLAGPDAMAEARRKHEQVMNAQRMEGYKSRAGVGRDTSATKVTADDDAKMNAEKYLGAPMSSTDWDLLKRTVYAESSRNEQEYANVMAVILNRARNSGKTIPEVLFEKNQFQAVTGARGEGPSSNFKQGPDARSAEMIMSSTNSLQNISTSLDSFTAANVAAYGAVGGQDKFNKKMAEMQAANGKTVGATVFAENLYRPSGKRIGDTSTMMASMTRESLMPQSPNVTVTAPATPQTQQQAPITIAAADVMDTDFGRLLSRMY